MLRTLLIIFGLLLSGCQNWEDLPQRNFPIILIRNNLPPISDTLILNQGKITYLFNLPAVRVFDASQTIDYDATSDTQKINMIGQHAIMRMRVNSLEQWDVFLNAGDTVLCINKDGCPLFSIENRTASFTEVNYDRLRRLRFFSGNYAPDVEFHNPTLIYLKTHSDVAQMPSYKELRERARERYIAFLELERDWLDSLYHQHLLRQVAYRHYACRNKYSRLFAQLDYQSDTELKSELMNYSDSVYVNHLYPFYRHYYDAVVEKLYCEPVSLTAQRNDYNFTVVFDRIEKDPLLSGRLKDRHLFNCFVKISETASITDVKKYYDKAVTTISDSMILSALYRDYALQFAGEITYSDDLTLLTTDGKTTTFSKIIATNLGKVIYVDFWASWCAPCMDGMPASKKLREYYKNKNVVFIYLAYNDKIQAWQKAIPIAGLDQVENVYLVTNPRTSTLVKKIRLESIPRYLIYDKTGRLININAPRPESNEIYKELNKMLD